MNRAQRILGAIGLVLFGVLLGVVIMAVVYDAKLSKPYHYDERVASGEWMIQVQTPPCAGVGHIQVIYPQESGYPISIECDLLPVGEK